MRAAGQHTGLRHRTLPLPFGVRCQLHFDPARDAAWRNRLARGPVFGGVWPLPSRMVIVHQSLTQIFGCQEPHNGPVFDTAVLPAQE